jgi:NADH:ubiquinone oxidoreductase subunit 6 (subunit J)
MLYVGGIMVLFLFVIMLVNLDPGRQAARSSTGNGWVALACVIVVGRKIGLSSSTRARDAFQGRPMDAAPPLRQPRNTETIADVLFPRIPAAL